MRRSPSTAGQRQDCAGRHTSTGSSRQHFALVQQYAGCQGDRSESASRLAGGFARKKRHDLRIGHEATTEPDGRRRPCYGLTISKTRLRNRIKIIMLL